MRKRNPNAALHGAATAPALKTEDNLILNPGLYPVH